MKVLWFTNNPCGAIEKLTGEKITSGGWLYALSKHVAQFPEIDLHIAFYWNSVKSQFEYEGVTYHPILRKSSQNNISKLFTLYKRTYSKIEDNKELEQINKVVSEVEPDIIHIHGTEDNFGLLYRYAPKCSIVVSIQGLISSYLYKFYSGYTKRAIIKNENLFKRILGLGIKNIERRYKIKSQNEIESLHNIQYVIGRTFWDRYCTQAINPSRKYFEVGEIMRQEFFDNQWHKTSFSNPLKIITTVSGGAYKGLDTIYQTANVLNQTNIKFEWNVIGVSQGDWRATLSEKELRCSSNKLNIRLVGRKDAEEMINLMTNSDIFVQVSHIENSPNSLCEAMLLGMPIIATYAGGTASLIKNGEEGLLVQDGDPYVMAGAIINLSQDFQRASEMGANAHNTSIHRHNPKEIVKQLVNAYNAIKSGSIK